MVWRISSLYLGSILDCRTDSVDRASCPHGGSLHFWRCSRGGRGSISYSVLREVVFPNPNSGDTEMNVATTQHQSLPAGNTQLTRFTGEWIEKPLVDLATITMGHSPPSVFYNSHGDGLPLIQGNADIKDRRTIDRVWSTQASKYCDLGDLILTVRAPVGTVAIASKSSYLGRGVSGLKPVGDSRFLFHALVHATGRWQILEQGSTFTAANSKQVAQFRLHVPKYNEEQRAIADVLSDVDALIEALEVLSAKKQAIKQAAMQQLLTGKTRLPGFSGAWGTKKISEVAVYCSEYNRLVEELPVLTCSKHLGFVDSLGYFKNQVFSQDLSGYKIIKRGQIGYPANHIEEGSIGLQDIYDVALVSPIYVVCSPKSSTNSYILHRLLKLGRYRQMFAKATDSSINRRGSLRWPAFSEIEIKLPHIDEQTAIAAVLSDMDSETAALERRLQKTRTIKQGMMQDLLTGRVRLVETEG